MKFSFTLLVAVVIQSVHGKFSFTSKILRKATAAVVASIPLALGPIAVFADAIPSVGTHAPDFVLPSNAGKPLSLSDFKGKRTVLYFYPGDFTQGCTIEAKAFESDLDKYTQLGAQIVGVSVDSVEKHLDFKKTYGLDFPLLSDQGGAVSAKYGSLLDFGFVGKFSNRQTYIISPEGNVEFVFTDVESRINDHSKDVLSKLKQLSASK